MLSTDFAELCGVHVWVLNQAVKRNIARFPEDFTFHLSKEEVFKITNCDLKEGARRASEILALRLYQAGIDGKIVKKEKRY